MQLIRDIYQPIETFYGTFIDHSEYFTRYSLAIRDILRDIGRQFGTFIDQSGHDSGHLPNEQAWSEFWGA